MKDIFKQAYILIVNIVCYSLPLFVIPKLNMWIIDIRRAF